MPDVQNTEPPPSPLACRSASLTGLICDMQDGHGGNMHSGVLGRPKIRVWWTRDGKMVNFQREPR